MSEPISKFVTLMRVQCGTRSYRTYWTSNGRIYCVPGRVPAERHPRRLALEPDFKTDLARSFDIYLSMAEAHGWTALGALEQLALEAE